MTHDGPPAVEAFAELAARHALRDEPGRSPDGLVERSLYSSDMVHRYAYGRWWGAQDLGTSDVWVLLNPATGDTERRRRPTLERCLTRSRLDGLSGVVVVNLFAHRDTDPAALRTAADPVGPADDDALRVLTRLGARCVAAWGADGGLFDRSSQVAPLLDHPLCLGTTRRGQPRHPLYVRGDTELVPWTAP